MNQVSRQKAQTDVEKDFYKLMSNTDFGNDCRNNANNSYFCQFMMKLINVCTQEGTTILLVKVLATLFHLKLLKDKLRMNF